MFFELPVELIYHLLSYLNYNDLFNLRKTCKKFKSLICSENFSKLIVFIQNYPYENDLFYLNEPVGQSYSLRIENLKKFKSIHFKNTFKHIKKLAIYHDDNKEYQNHFEENEKLKSLFINFDKDLNYFEDLIHLEINQVGRITGCLKLKNLRRCLMNTREISKIRLECANLTTLCLMNGVQPEVIGDNLEYLKIENIESNFLAEFIKLNRPNTLCLSLASDFFKNLTLIRSILNKSNDIKLFFHDIRIDSEQSIRNLIEIFQFLETKESFEFFYNEEISFDRLLSNMNKIELNQNNEIDQKLIFKLRSIKFAKIENKILDETLFFSILRNWKKLKELTLVSTRLHQASFDLMPSYFQNLRVLIIRNCKIDNLDFIVQFKNLTKIGISKINFRLKKQKLRYLIDSSLTLRSFQILDHQKNMAILIDKQINRFTFKEKDIKTLLFYCLDSLVDFVYSNL